MCLLDLNFLLVAKIMKFRQVPTISQLIEAGYLFSRTVFKAAIFLTSIVRLGSRKTISVFV